MKTHATNREDQLVGSSFSGKSRASTAGQGCVRAAERHESMFLANFLLWKARFRPRLIGFQADTCLKQVVWLNELSSSSLTLAGLRWGLAFGPDGVIL